MCDQQIRLGDQVRRCGLARPTGHRGDCVYTLNVLERALVGKRKVVIRWAE